MPKTAKMMSALQVATLKKDGLYSVGGAPGLCLKIDGGSKSWVLRYAADGRQRKTGLGAFPAVSLADARKTARAFREKLRGGVDPIAERKEAAAKVRLEAAKAKTFRECAEAYMETHRGEWKNAKHAKQWESTLAAYVYPTIGKLPVADIDTGLVLGVLQQPMTDRGETLTLWNARPETASRLRGRMESVLDWAKVRGFRQGENPADWKTLKHTLPARNKVKKVEHFAALPYTEVGAFMVALRRKRGMSARALEFLILTAARSGEVRGATWKEIDLGRRLWTVPAKRMKMRVEHRVPLSPAAVRLLEAMPRFEGTKYVFPTHGGGTLTDMPLTMLLRRMTQTGEIARKVTAHGFRSTFRDWAGETTRHPREVCEHALAHGLKDGVEGAYQRGDMLDKRRRLMEDWATYCGTVQTARGENVVPIGRVV